jgi:hypothetical protein
MRGRVPSSPGILRGVLTLQVVPLLLLPPESFGAHSQEWWLPVLLTIMVVAADLELLVRRGQALWPWHLMLFAQGFNIISRLMMMWPHATRTVQGVSTFNVPYLTLTLVAMGASTFLLWYLELPEVRRVMVRDAVTPGQS